MMPKTLFPMDGPDPYNGLKHPRRPCVPTLLGTGPDGRTCGECEHCVIVQHHDRNYHKCDEMQDYWSHGHKGGLGCLLVF